MGSYHLIVNPVKREYLDPGRFGENPKFSGVLHGELHGQALKYLILDCGSATDAESEFYGRWVGDPIILADDDTGCPNPPGVTTATTNLPRRNLHEMARQEFTDISYRAIAYLAAHNATTLLERAEQSQSFLIDLVNVTFQYRLPALEFQIRENWGKDWRRRYDKACRECPWHSPLKAIDPPPTQ